MPFIVPPCDYHPCALCRLYLRICAVLSCRQRVCVEVVYTAYKVRSDLAPQCVYCICAVLSCRQRVCVVVVCVCGAAGWGKKDNAVREETGAPLRQEDRLLGLVLYIYIAAGCRLETITINDELLIINQSINQRSSQNHTRAEVKPHPTAPPQG